MQKIHSCSENKYENCRLLFHIIMAKIQISNYIMCNILVQLILLVVVKAVSLSSNFIDDYSQFEGSHRLKRVAGVLPPSTIDMTIIDAGEEIKIQLKQVNRFLVNENLPVYLARRNSSHQPFHKKKSMAEFGKIIQYHDTKTRASGVYFLNYDKLVGEIGSTYKFMIPYSELFKPLEVGQKYVRRQPHRDHGIRKCPIEYKGGSVPLPSAQYNVKKREINLKQLNISHIQVRRDAPDSNVENSYIETLLFIPYDIAQIQ